MAWDAAASEVRLNTAVAWSRAAPQQAVSDGAAAANEAAAGAGLAQRAMRMPLEVPLYISESRKEKLDYAGIFVRDRCFSASDPEPHNGPGKW